MVLITDPQLYIIPLLVNFSGELEHIFQSWSDVLHIYLTKRRSCQAERLLVCNSIDQYTFDVCAMQYGDHNMVIFRHCIIWLYSDIA